MKATELSEIMCAPLQT